MSEEVSAFADFALSEKLVVNFGNINSSDGDFGTGCDGIGLVNTLKWHSVHLVRSGDQEKS